MSDNPFEDPNENAYKPNDIFGKGYQTGFNAQQQNAQSQPSPNSPSFTPQQSQPKLEFQDFNLSHDSSPAYNQPLLQPNQSEPIRQQTEPIFGESPNVPQEPQQLKTYRIWNIEYYRFLFDVNTTQVLSRVLRSMVPYPPTFFEHIQPNPDLYGPFWIASTVVFLLAATGNVASYLNNLSQEGDEWHYDVDKLSYAAAAIYGYLLLLPLILWAIFKYSKIGVTYLDMICLYGYSFFIYVPISVICIVPINALRWGVVMGAGLISTAFLLFNSFSKLRQYGAKSFIILLVMGVLHMGFAFACQLYFFSY